MRFEKKIEIENIFRIQVKISTSVQFQKTDFFLGEEVLFKKIEFEQKVRALW